LAEAATASKLLVATGAALLAAGATADGASCLEQAPNINAIKAASSAEKVERFKRLLSHKLIQALFWQRNHALVDCRVT
jgi:hypothetical protein